MKPAALPLCLLLVLPAYAADRPAAVDFPGFMEDSSEAFEHRKERLVDIEAFNRMAEEGALILDTRSHPNFMARHMRGAVHLNFSDITEEALEAVIGSKDRVVLIYCNNNFEGDPAVFALKKLEAALNIPTYVALYTYGYRNVHELSDLLHIEDPRLELAGLAESS